MEKLCLHCGGQSLGEMLMLRLNESKLVHFIHAVMQWWIISLQERRQ